MGERDQASQSDGDSESDARAAYELWSVLRRQVTGKSGPDYVVAMIELYRQCQAITRTRR